MKSRAAVAWKVNEPLRVETVDVDGPNANEVLVEIKAAAISEADVMALADTNPNSTFPVILGHQGAGIVRDIGSGVTTLKPGDHVIPLYLPECRQCEVCLSRRSNLCSALLPTQNQGLMPNGTSRFRCEGQPVLHHKGCSTFSNFIVMPEIALANVREDAPFDKICCIGGDVTTGIGAVIYTAKVWPGSKVVVFGLNGIGLNVIQGADLAGADQIIGIDDDGGKERIGEKFGMTDFIDLREVGPQNVVEAVKEITRSGADFSFVCRGGTQAITMALECSHNAWGQSILTDGVGPDSEVHARSFQLIAGRSWRGSTFGGARGRTDIPKIVDWYMDGRINIEDLVKTVGLNDINTAFDLVRSRKSPCAVIVY